jgi:hypothetical protein
LPPVNRNAARKLAYSRLNTVRCREPRWSGSRRQGKGGIVRREWSYEVSRERLAGFVREANRKAYKRLLSSRFFYWTILLALAGAASYNGRAVEAWLRGVGIPASANALAAIAALLIVAVLWEWRRFNVSQAAQRMDYDPAVRLTQDEGGLRFAGKGVETYVKWEAIGRMEEVADGVAIWCGEVVWFIPDTAFGGDAGRRAFIQDVNGHLSEAARAPREG